jgi:hypothetical protein
LLIRIGKSLFLHLACRLQFSLDPEIIEVLVNQFYETNTSKHKMLAKSLPDAFNNRRLLLAVKLLAHSDVPVIPQTTIGNTMPSASTLQLNLY